MSDLEKARSEINQLDIELAELFEKRMKVSAKIAQYKKEHGLSIRDEAREEALIEKNRTYIEDPAIESYYVQFLRNVINISCNYQSSLIKGIRVAYCGVEGAYAYIASKKFFPEGELESCPEFQAAYSAVEDGKYDCAVLPIENSYAGEVGKVMDIIFSGGLYINQVMDLPIRHCLMANKGANIKDIKKVMSHPQALSQCKNYISKHGFETVENTNTAVSAKTVLESGDMTMAAIASEETAQIYGLEILEAGINDVQNNTTRFAVMSRVPNNPNFSKVRGDESFILMFTVQNKAGALAQTLNIIGAHGYNMRSLRSRPMKELQWNYYFYVEAEGNVNNQNGKDMMRELSAICARLKLVGTFNTESRL